MQGVIKAYDPVSRLGVLVCDRDLADCARIGAVAAGEVISHVGPRPLVELRTLAR